MRHQDEWAPVFGWRLRDVAHLILNKPIEELPWTDQSGANLVVYPWWNELFTILELFEGVDVYDVPMFGDGFWGPNPSSQVGCIDAVFLGVMIRLPFHASPRSALHENSQITQYINNLDISDEEKAEKFEPWAKRLANTSYTLEYDRIQEMQLGFKHLDEFIKDYPNLPPLIQADGNHPDHHDDIEPTMDIRFLLEIRGWKNQIIDKRAKKS